jgi:hypothetical protein
MKQRAEEGDFGLGGGMLIRTSLVQDRQSDKGVHDPILHLHPPQSSNEGPNGRESVSPQNSQRDRACQLVCLMDLGPT